MGKKKKKDKTSHAVTRLSTLIVEFGVGSAIPHPTISWVLLVYATSLNATYEVAFTV